MSESLPDELLVVLTTAPSREEGERLARGLVERGVAACVNVSARMRSFFHWNGELCSDDEVQLFIKTTAASYEGLAAVIQELHSYDLPEILALPVARADAGYGAWLRAQVRAPDEPDRGDGASSRAKQG